MRDEVQPRAALVVGTRDMPWRVFGVRSLQHLITFRFTLLTASVGTDGINPRAALTQPAASASAAMATQGLTALALAPLGSAARSTRPSAPDCPRR